MVVEADFPTNPNKGFSVNHKANYLVRSGNISTNSVCVWLPPPGIPLSNSNLINQLDDKNR